MSELPFSGFSELIEKPLIKKDIHSLNAIKRIFLDEPSTINNPFSTLINKLTGKDLANGDAITHWKKIIDNKRWLEQRIGRVISIQAAAIDYFSSQISTTPILSIPVASPAKPVLQKSNEEWIDRIYTPGYHLEKLKEEMMRAKRYKNALATIFLDIDNFKAVNTALGNSGGDQVLTLVVKIIKKTIRTVDIITRYSGDRFLLILPNTNKREAQELAERIRENVAQRTKTISNYSSGISITLSVGQCSKDDSSMDYLKRLVNTLDDGKRKKRNSVYVM
ncbi:MAG: GGDEF domain-containing protein [Fibrobacter sp.]|mgnify:CR=1 FL=1|nr:GGDEF domain-containing protein [Fibrobacter sp.]